MAQESATPAGTTRPPGGRAGRGPDGGRPTATYRERLIVPWWAWPIGLGLAAFLSAEVFLGAPTALVWVPYVILVPGAAIGLAMLSRITVRVADGELHVDDAHLPVSYVSEVNVLNAEAKRALLGPVAERYAFIVQRPWIGGAVRVVIDDPADPTPYWVISSRRPAALASAIVIARDEAAGPSGRQ